MIRFRIDTVKMTGIKFYTFGAMVKWLYKILFILITFSFVLSACEIDIGDCHNTFFDDFDTYVKTEQVSIDHDHTSIFLAQEFSLLVLGFCSVFLLRPSALRHHLKKARFWFCTQPEKIFLLNSVWRI